MKLFKLISLLGFSAFIATNTVQAVEKTTPSKQPVAKQAESQKKDVRLERFNKSVGIRFTERGLQSQNNQPVVTLTYSIENNRLLAENTDFFYLVTDTNLDNLENEKAEAYLKEFSQLDTTAPGYAEKLIELQLKYGLAYKYKYKYNLVRQ